MADPSAQRTLVKSPPELWAEVSDAGALARHLGEFGEIRITRLEAETTVVWEGDRASGTVKLEPAGWGTKVTITAVPVAEPAPEPEPEAPVAAQAEPEPAAVVPEPEPAEPEPVPAPVAPAEPQRKPGFFARLFGRRHPPAPVVEVTPPPPPPPPPPPEPEPEPEPVVTLPEPEPEPDLDPAAGAAIDEEHAVAVLTAVLDDLGSAHHRPFSRG